MRREKITGLDLGPSSPLSPEPERPDSLPACRECLFPSNSAFGMPVRE